MFIPVWMFIPGWNTQDSCGQSSVCALLDPADDGADGDAIILASSLVPGVIGATLPGCSPGQQRPPAPAHDGDSTVLQVTQAVTQGVTQRG